MTTASSIMSTPTSGTVRTRLLQHPGGVSIMWVGTATVVRLGLVPDALQWGRRILPH
jgi:hypothetical protein